MSISLAIRSFQSRNRAPAGRAVATVPRRGIKQPTHPLVGAGVAQIERALLDSEMGRMEMLMDLYEDMRERDGRLDSVCRTRVLAVAGKRWNIKPSDDLIDDPRAQKVADQIASILGAVEELPLVMGQLMDGVLRGYAVQEIEWGTDDRGRAVPTRLHWIHPGRFNFTGEMELAKYDPGEDIYPGTPLSDFGPDRFIVHMPHAGRSTYPVRRGALRSTIFPTLTKRYGLRWWLRAAERFGQPAPYITVPPGAEEVRTAAEQVLRNLTDDWQAVLTKDMEINVIEGSGTFTGELHGRLVDMINV